MRIKISKKFLLSTPLALISLQIFLGIVLGYLFGRVVSGEKPGQPGKIRSIIFKIGRYRLHLHHWLLSTGMLAFNLLAGIFLPFPRFSMSFLGGLMIQGILCYSDWYKVLIKRT